MFRLFHDNNIDFLGKKHIFMTVSVILMLIGCVAVAIKGFNLGVDFAGGSLYYVRFTAAPSTDDIRVALRDQGIDTSKVIIQPISSGGRSASTGESLLIRLPADAGGIAADADGGIGGQKRVVLKALGTFNKDLTNAPGKGDINTADEAELTTEVRAAGVQLDPTVNLDALAIRILEHRNAQPKGVYESIETVRQVPDLPQPVADAIVANFYAGKIDINTVGGEDFLSLLKRLDPLNLAADAANADVTYKQIRDAFVDYRDKTQGGVVGSIDEIPLGDNAQPVKDVLNERFYVGAFNITNAESVGAQVGDDLRNRAIYVTLASLVGMLIFIAFRFEWIYGVSAVMAVFHDVPVTLGLFAMFGWEVNLTVIAALLTLIGYSTNDTIVIFDRIRETLRLNRRDPIEKVTNDAINQTLSRTIISSGTAFVTVLVLTLFGGDVLKSFSLVLLIGIIIGTYSSIGIASPIMIWWTRRHRTQKALAGSPVESARAEKANRAVRTAKTI